MNEPTISIHAASADQATAGESHRTVKAPPLRENGDHESSVDAIKDETIAVRQFHRLNLADDDRLPRVRKDFLPALLDPYRDASKIRHEYPLFLFPPDSIDGSEFCVGFSDLIARIVAGFAPDPDDARILKDNLVRLEKYVREAMPGRREHEIDAVDVLTAASEKMIADLALKERAAADLRGYLHSVMRAMPAGGTLLDLQAGTSFELYVQVAGYFARTRSAALRNEAELLRNRLIELVRIDRIKDSGSRDPGRLGKSVGAVGSRYLDAQHLANVLGPARGAEPMPATRRNRIETVIHTLEGYISTAVGTTITCIAANPCPATLSSSDVRWQRIETNVCNAAADAFDSQAETYARLFAAIRVARLELAEAYDASRHDELLHGFDWRSFSDEELLTLPPILVFASSTEIAGDGFVSLSRILRTGRIIRVLLTVRSESDPTGADESTPTIGHRFELGFLGISHRAALVHQSTAARPAHLTAGMVRACNAASPALHLVCETRTMDNGASAQLGPWMIESAAVESRAHPLFIYDPAAGETWARRFDLSDNPSADSDWPAGEFTLESGGKSRETLPLQFTFADFALLFKEYQPHFRIISASCEDEHLVPLGEFFALDDKAAADHVPFVHAVDADGALHRLVITRDLLTYCIDRLSYWHTLQELAGIGNEHVERAVRTERERLTGEFEAERRTMQEQHRQELDRIRKEAAANAFQKLAQTLLETDASTLAATLTSSQNAGTTTGSISRAAPAPMAPAAEAESAREMPKEPDSPTQVESTAAEPPEEEDEIAEPWIDSTLCTSCNDCMQINPRVFVYNSKKQATIGDPRAGTYAEIVKAAEKCPARCIHPGKPLNPDEPNLEELKKRAEKFN